MESKRQSTGQQGFRRLIGSLCPHQVVGGDTIGLFAQVYLIKCRCGIKHIGRRGMRIISHKINRHIIDSYPRSGREVHCTSTANCGIFHVKSIVQYILVLRVEHIDTYRIFAFPLTGFAIQPCRKTVISRTDGTKPFLTVAIRKRTFINFATSYCQSTGNCQKKQMFQIHTIIF